MQAGLTVENNVSINESAINETSVKSVYNKLIFGQVNIRSILKISETGSRLDELKHFMSENKICILALTETHLGDSIDDDVIAIDGFKLFRKDRKKGAGGLKLVYVIKTLCLVYVIVHQIKV